MKIMKILAAFCMTILCFGFLAAQNNTKDSVQKNLQQTEMVKMEKLIGKWAGAGWIQQGREREEFTGTETVQRKIDGLALLVEGRFTDKRDASKVIHETLAVLSYNPEKRGYDFQTFLASGNKGLMNFAIKGEDYEWGFDSPAGKILYVISIKNDTWHETGKVSRDGGKSWFQFFEMNLKKQ